VVSRRRAGLVDRGRRLLRAAERVLEPVVRIADPGALDTESDPELDAVLAGLIVQLGEQLPTSADPVAVAGLLADAYALRRDIDEFLAAERLRRSAALEAGLAGLRRLRDPDELVDRVCPAVVDSCGFDRVMLSRVEGSVWRPWKSHAVDVRDPERAFREWLRAIPEIQLGSMLLETEMARRRAPALVTDPVNDPRVHQPMVLASRLDSYVAAPLMPAGRVIGFLHADYQEAPVTALDRDVLWAFAEGFGRIFERAVLLNRLGEQRERVRSAMRTVESVLDDLASAEIALATQASADVPIADRPSLAAPVAALASLLTGRELEVLTLMATGATNQRIADELVIASGTVKSHVKAILRKLCVENRAEAISQYLRLTIGDSAR
jgi:DNA-binding CsgD family transcriptional regulator